MNRRTVLIGSMASTSFAILPRLANAATLPKLEVYRNPGCGCCEAWAQLMKDAGFAVTIEEDADLDARREKLHIPGELSGCHIAMSDGYAFEGHVPVADILKFLNERPDGAIGLIVPGMPAGSPGMGAEGSGKPYDVLLLRANAAPTVYASH